MSVIRYQPSEPTDPIKGFRSMNHGDCLTWRRLANRTYKVWDSKHPEFGHWIMDEFAWETFLELWTANEITPWVTGATAFELSPAERGEQVVVTLNRVSDDEFEFSLSGTDAKLTFNFAEMEAFWIGAQMGQFRPDDTFMTDLPGGVIVHAWPSGHRDVHTGR